MRNLPCGSLSLFYKTGFKLNSSEIVQLALCNSNGVWTCTAAGSTDSGLDSQALRYADQAFRSYAARSTQSSCRVSPTISSTPEIRKVHLGLRSDGCPDQGATRGW